MKLMKKVIGFAMAATMCFSLAACGGEEEPAAEEASLSVPISDDIGDINAHLYDGDMMSQGMVFEGLVQNTADGVAPCLAESWDISEDGTVYTFHLRQDVTFTDGEPFNAEAVKANIDAVQANSERHSWMGLCSRVVSCDVVDDYTVDLVLSEAYYPALTELGLTRPYRMMSPASFIDGGTADGVSYYAGTGAYVLDDSVQDQYAVFKANEDYWGGAPDIKTITLKVMSAGESTMMALEKGEVNFLFGTYYTAMVDADSLVNLESNDDYQSVFSDPCSTGFLLTNSKPERQISDKNIKEAVWYAINRDDLCSTVFSGLETPAQTAFASTVPYCDVDLEARDYSVDTAKSLVEDSGWTMDESTGYYTKDGETLNLEILYNSSVATNKTLCEYLQSNLKDVGIEATLTPAESATIYDVRDSGEFDLLLDSTWGLPYDPQSSLNSLFSSYLNAVSELDCYDDLYEEINAALVSTDETERQAYYTEILETMQEECIFIPLAYSRASIVTSADIGNLSFSQTQYEVPFKDFTVN